MPPHKHIVIIGNGIAGITLAQHLRQHTANPITIISSESATHFSRTALMYVYMGHMQYKDIVPYEDWYWKENKLHLFHDRVENVNFENKNLLLKDGGTLAYDILILATGSKTAYYNWPGENLKGVQGLVTLQDLEKMEQMTRSVKEAVIVGGGLIGIEMAEMLHSRQIKVTMLVRDTFFWRSILPEAEAKLITEHIKGRGIYLRLQEELAEILPDSQGKVRAVSLRSGEIIPCTFIGIATGVKPNVDFLHQSGLETDRGILVNNFFETNIPDVYAIGDCAQFRTPAQDNPAIEQLWYTARLHGEALATILKGRRIPYNRGPWFNSAKFFDIEYQTYGYVPNHNDERYDALYWEHPDGTKAIRLVYARDSEEIAGFNLLGVRYRHDLCHHWLTQKFKLHDVINQLQAANFDPEFYKKYESEIRSQYLQRFPHQKELLQNKKSDWWLLRRNFNLFQKNQSC